MEHASPGRPERMLTFRSGGWVILLAGILVVLVVVSQAGNLLGSSNSRAIGDGVNPESYGFPLSPATVPVERIVAGGFPKGGLPVLVHPPVWSAEEADRYNQEHRGKYLVTGDLVIGVRIGNEDRAYPLRVLNWHEVVNDTLGGREILVTYNPLAGSAVVFDRSIPDASGEDEPDFDVSGLLFNSAHLLFDRRENPSLESLWSTLLARAVTGPAAGAERGLRVIPCSLAGWAAWKRLHPATTVLAVDPGDVKKKYRRDPYANYRGDERLRFPVDPAPPAGDLRPKEPVLVVGTGPNRTVFPFEVVSEAAGAGRRLTVQAGGREIVLEVLADPETIIVSPETDSEGLEVFYSFWFAWNATHPGDPVFRTPRSL